MCGAGKDDSAAEPSPDDIVEVYQGDSDVMMSELGTMYTMTSEPTTGHIMMSEDTTSAHGAGKSTGVRYTLSSEGELNAITNQVVDGERAEEGCGGLTSDWSEERGLALKERRDSEGTRLSSADTMANGAGFASHTDGTERMATLDSTDGLAISSTNQTNMAYLCRRYEMSTSATHSTSAHAPTGLGDVTSAAAARGSCAESSAKRHAASSALSTDGTSSTQESTHSEELGGFISSELRQATELAIHVTKLLQVSSSSEAEAVNGAGFASNTDGAESMATLETFMQSAHVQSDHACGRSCGRSHDKDRWSRLCCACLPLQMLMLLLLGLACLLPMSEEEFGCTLGNNLEHSLNVLLRYRDGSPPV